MKLRSVLAVLGMLAIVPLTSCAESLYASPKAKVEFNVVAMPPGDHIGQISWTPVGDGAGAPTSFEVTVRLSLNGALQVTLPGYPKTVTTTSDDFIRAPGGTEFGNFVYTTEVRQIRRGLVGPAAIRTSTVTRTDIAPPAPTGVTVTVTVAP